MAGHRGAGMIPVHKIVVWYCECTKPNICCKNESATYKTVLPYQILVKAVLRWQECCLLFSTYGQNQVGFIVGGFHHIISSSLRNCEWRVLTPLWFSFVLHCFLKAEWCRCFAALIDGVLQQFFASTTTTRDNCSACGSIAKITMYSQCNLELGFGLTDSRLCDEVDCSLLWYFKVTEWS